MKNNSSSQNKRIHEKKKKKKKILFRRWTVHHLWAWWVAVSFWDSRKEAQVKSELIIDICSRVDLHIAVYGIHGRREGLKSFVHPVGIFLIDKKCHSFIYIYIFCLFICLSVPALNCSKPNLQSSLEHANP